MLVIIGSLFIKVQIKLPRKILVTLYLCTIVPICRYGVCTNQCNIKEQCILKCCLKFFII